ncbi:MAG TPA: hypothetical protein VLB73_00170 [Patescibacteria group bacterium]|nr:hypothetical protein [Patescibacteria group bacterium]
MRWRPNGTHRVRRGIAEPNVHAGPVETRAILGRPTSKRKKHQQRVEKSRAHDPEQGGRREEE